MSEVTSWQRRLAVVVSVVALLAACTSGDDPGGDSAAVGGGATGLYLVNTNAGTGVMRRLPPGTLEGVKAVLPGVTFDSDFRSRMDTLDPSLKRTGYSYGSESYDAVVLIALATQQARSDAGIDVAAQMQSVSEGGQKCDSYATCNDLISRGEDADYEGVSGPVGLDETGELASATSGIYEYDGDNRLPGYDIDGQPLDLVSDELPQASDGPVQLSTQVNVAANGQLQIGGYLPLTGAQALLGPSEVAGATLAVTDVNDAGGVLGKSVTFTNGASLDASDFDQGVEAIQQQLELGVDAIIGAAAANACSGTLRQIATAGVIQVAPSGTCTQASVRGDQGLFFRTSPSEPSQAQVLGNLLNTDNRRTTAIVAVSDRYGRSLATQIADVYQAGGGQVVVEPSTTEKAIFYDPTKDSARQLATQLASLEPEAIVLIGYDETVTLVRQLAKLGLVPSSG